MIPACLAVFLIPQMHDPKKLHLVKMTNQAFQWYKIIPIGDQNAFKLFGIEIFIYDVFLYCFLFLMYYKTTDLSTIQKHVPTILNVSFILRVFQYILSHTDVSLLHSSILSNP